MNQYAEKVIGSGDLRVYTGSLHYAFKEPLIKIRTIFVSKKMHHIFLAKRYTIFVCRDTSGLRRKRALLNSRKKITSWEKNPHLMAAPLIMAKPGEVHCRPALHTNICCIPVLAN